MTALQSPRHERSGIMRWSSHNPPQEIALLKYSKHETERQEGSYHITSMLKFTGPEPTMIPTVATLRGFRSTSNLNRNDACPGAEEPGIVELRQRSVQLWLGLNQQLPRPCLQVAAWRPVLLPSRCLSHSSPNASPKHGARTGFQKQS